MNPKTEPHLSACSESLDYQLSLYSLQISILFIRKWFTIVRQPLLPLCGKCLCLFLHLVLKTELSTDVLISLLQILNVHCVPCKTHTASIKVFRRITDTID